MICVHICLQLRRDLGGVECTPTVLVVLFERQRKKIAQIEGVDKIRGAIRSGAAEALISAFMEERVKLRMADRLAEQMALRLALGVAMAGAAGAARRRRDEELRERFEADMERQVQERTRRQQQQQPKPKEDDDDDDKGEVRKAHVRGCVRRCLSCPGVGWANPGESVATVSPQLTIVMEQKRRLFFYVFVVYCSPFFYLGGSHQSIYYRSSCLPISAPYYKQRCCFE